MKLSQQLRIGNLIYRINKVITVHARTIESIHDLEVLGIQDMFKPISITHEWLDRLGFMYENPTVGGYEKWVIITEKNRMIKLLDKKFTWGAGEYGDYILHVHQLQNLYFSLTGKELEIKL